jgi:hypothetical protein
MPSRLALAGILALAALPAFAQTDTPVIDQRQLNQQQRIDRGVASGALTPNETANLQKRENAIAGKEAAAKADGTVTPGERARLNRAENRASGAIARKKHNKRTANQP